MPGQPVISSSPGVLSAGLQDAFFDTYIPTFENTKARLSRIAEFIPSDKETERFAFYESPPHAAIWRDGESVRRKGFKDQTWTVPVRDWGIAVDWSKNHRMDDQTRSLRQQADGAGTNMALVDERVLVQIITAATDTNLLPSIPNSPDGLALFSTSTRYGASGGNTVTGSGVATSASIETDFYAAVARIMAFQDTEGQPLWDPSIFNQGFLVMAGSANIKEMNRAFKADAVPIGSSTATSNAAVSNVIQVGGYNVEVWLTPRITSNDWFVFATGARRKPLVVLERQAIETHEGNMDNSDSARATKIEYVQFDKRTGYGVATPYAAVMVDN